MYTDKLIPMEEVWKDINSDDDLVASAAFDYYLVHYASPELKEKHKKDKKSISQRVYSFLWKIFPWLRNK